MEKPVRAEIVSIGTELLRGEIVDTNANYIASQLPLLGIELHRMTTSGDIQSELCQILEQALVKTDIVITTGGLGPTQDDLTREAVAELTQETLTLDAEQEIILRTLFSRTNREMPPSNLNQAKLIPSAKALPNPRGTAPGWWVEKNKKVIVLMPGPPREMIPMWQNEVIPRIKKHFPVQKILARAIKTFSLPESKVGEYLGTFFSQTNMTTGIYAKADGIQVRFIAQGNDAAQILDEADKQLTAMLKPYIWGRDEDTLAGIASRIFIKHGLTLATMEDATGGLLGSILNSSPESMKYYRGGLIAPTNESKIASGIPDEVLRMNGATSVQVAESMATAVRKAFASNFGLSVTAIEAKPDKPPTIYISVSDNTGVRTWLQQHPLGRADNKERAATATLFHLWERLGELKLLD